MAVTYQIGIDVIGGKATAIVQAVDGTKSLGSVGQSSADGGILSDANLNLISGSTGTASAITGTASTYLDVATQFDNALNTSAKVLPIIENTTVGLGVVGGLANIGLFLNEYSSKPSLGEVSTSTGLNASAGMFAIGAGITVLLAPEALIALGTMGAMSTVLTAIALFQKGTLGSTASSIQSDINSTLNVLQTFTDSVLNMVSNLDQNGMQVSNFNQDASGSVTLTATSTTGNTTLTQAVNINTNGAITNQTNLQTNNLTGITNAQSYNSNGTLVNNAVITGTVTQAKIDQLTNISNTLDEGTAATTADLMFSMGTDTKNISTSQLQNINNQFSSSTISSTSIAPVTATPSVPTVTSKPVVVTSPPPIISNQPYIPSTGPSIYDYNQEFGYNGGGGSFTVDFGGFDPLVLNLNGGDVHTTSLANSTVSFDM